MIGSKIALVGAVLLVVGVAMYFLAIGDVRAKYGETQYNICSRADASALPECKSLLSYQADHPLRVWGFLIGAVGAFVIIIGILIVFLLRKPKKRIVEKIFYKCPDCGFGNDEDAEFCKKCGHSLKKPKKPAPLPVV